jgi:hypothetical protein
MKLLKLGARMLMGASFLLLVLLLLPLALVSWLFSGVDDFPQP